MADHERRLADVLAEAGSSAALTPLSQDASTREYFRIEWHGRPAVACVYPEPFAAAEHNYIDVTALFEAGGLPVAEIYFVDEARGVIILEDLGDVVLREFLAELHQPEREKYIDDAIRLIAKIQSATPLAFEMGSISGKLRFDKEKLLWELEFFLEHYFTTYRKTPLPDDQANAIRREFAELAAALEERARVLCHRDFHAANLMVASDGSLHIIDHQDARIGSVAYDLVSLLLDRVTEPPEAGWVSTKRTVLLREREDLGLEKIDAEEFAEEFRLQAIQRCLKAVGTFSYQSSVRGKSYFIPYIRPMLQITMAAVRDASRFPTLEKVLAHELMS
jgi:N-acetylmuramate 1-kinase